MVSETTRVALSFDWQNCYRSARDAFGAGTNGNVNPYQLGRHLALGRPSGTLPGELQAVEIYSGMPSQRRDPGSYAARRRQHAAWVRQSPLVHLHTRTLVYRPGPVEKGIDVAIAIDLVRQVVFQKTCDVAILISADTDLLPALELIVEERGPEAIKVAAWDGGPPALQTPGGRVRQHRLTEKLYRRFEDRTDYSSGPR